jgi:hypothetical protein
VITTRLLPNGDVTLTIEDDTPASVVGDFHDWSLRALVDNSTVVGMSPCPSPHGDMLST